MTRTRAVSFETGVKPENKDHYAGSPTPMRKPTRIIRENLDSPLISGVIEGVGARYPHIETKVSDLPDKTAPAFRIEPMGLNTEELYVQGFSSSMPEVPAKCPQSRPGKPR